MPIVKTVDGRVITKGGLVSCSCCEPQCCLYPWREFEEYPDTDLPAGVTYEGDTLSRSGSSFEGGTYKILDGEEGWEVRTIEGNTLVKTLSCLISGGVHDLFSLSYLVEEFLFDPLIVTRDSLCEWIGFGDIEGTPYTLYLRYNPGIFAWEIQNTFSGAYDKTPPQDGPAGVYAEGQITVS